MKISMSVWKVDGVEKIIYRLQLIYSKINLDDSNNNRKYNIIIKTSLSIF